MRIGFIGLGIMGSRMAARLQEAGHELTLHNRTRAKGEALVAAGARWADSPAGAARDAEVVFTVLSAPEAVEASALGESGLLAGMGRDALWVDSSTVDPAFSRRMAQAAQAKGARFLDAPVAGSKKPAERGELTFLVGGAESDVAQARPLLEAMGSTINHVGGHGMGASLKMVFNLLLDQGMVAFCEAFTLGEALGLDREALLESLIGGRMTPGFLAPKKAKFSAGDYEADFPLQWMHKDLHLVASTAYGMGLALPNANIAKETFAQANRLGLGEQDYAAVLKVFESRKLG